ncbi:MAG: DciA family protein [Nitrospinales bacterium]
MVESMVGQKRNKYGWSGMKVIIPDTLRGVPSQVDNMLEWLSLQWSLSVGEELAGITQIDRESKKTLYVLVKDEGWLSVLKRMEDKILPEINGRLENDRFSRIKFRVGPITNKRPVSGSGLEKKNSFPKKMASGEKPKVDLNLIKDPELRKTLSNLSKKFQFTSLIISCVFLYSCSTMEPAKGITVDLSDSLSVKKINELNKKTPEAGYRDPRSYFSYLMALKAERNRDFKEAAEHYIAAVKNDPTQEEFFEKLVLFLQRSGQFKRATEWGEKGIEKFPKNVDIRTVLADVLSSMGEKQKALEHYKKITDVDPGNSRGYLLAGYTHYELGQDSEAQESFKQALLVEEANPFSLYFYGKSLVSQGKIDEAIEKFKKALGLRPSFLLAREHLAWHLEGQNNYKETVHQYKIILKLTPQRKEIEKYLSKVAPDGESAPEFNGALFEANPPPPFKDPDIHMLIGVIFYEQAIYTKSIDEFRLLLHKKEDKTIRLSLAKIYELYGKLDLAIEEIEAFRRNSTEPDSLNVLLSLARLYGMNDEIDKSIQLIQQAIALEPEKASLHHSLALAYMSDNKNELAIQSMRKAIAINDKTGAYHFELGALLERVGKYEDAITSMEKALELNPNHSNAHNFIGYIYSVRGENLDKALDHLTKALAIQPKNGYFLDSLGWIYYQKGDSERALTEIKRAMVYTSPDPVLYDHLGDVHFSLENYLEAKKAWSTSLTLTLKKDEDYAGEIPDTEKVREKINKVDRILQISY